VRQQRQEEGISVDGSDGANNRGNANIEVGGGGEGGGG
jgi:hypothetical protein